MVSNTHFVNARIKKRDSTADRVRKAGEEKRRHGGEEPQ